jgi:biotin synthase
MTPLAVLLSQAAFTRADLVTLLSVRAPEDIEAIRQAAERVLLAHCSDAVYYRGLIEFSNVCVRDCAYCGIRRGNAGVARYTLAEDRIVEAARWCAAQGYGSVVLQSGERSDEAFVALVERVVRRIKAETRSAAQPEGLGVTLCVGEQSPETYRRFFAAGAHRYLLRIETTNPALFAAIHPPDQTLAARLACLRALRAEGFQVGTGVMIGLPGQSLEMLADDLLFFRDADMDMIGMGPYIPHPDTPLGRAMPDAGTGRRPVLQRSLLMIAAARLLLRDVNIAATTALQAMDPRGREEGLRFGANILMPQLTPRENRRDYLLYPDKPCTDEDRGDCAACLAGRIRSVGRRLALNVWGDSPHAAARQAGGPQAVWNPQVSCKRG